MNRTYLIVECLVDGDLFLLHLGAKNVDRRTANLGRIDELEVQLQFACDDTGDVQQVVDQLDLKLRVTLDNCQAALEPLAIEVSLANHLRPPENGIQRLSKLV